MKKTLALMTALFLLVAGLAGCAGDTGGTGGGNSTQSAEGQAGAASPGDGQTPFGIAPLSQRTSVKVALFAGSHHGNAFTVADRMGWLDALNIDAEFIPFINGPVMMEAMNDWDMGTTGGPGCINGMVGRDLKVLAMASADAELKLFVREDSPIYLSGQGNIEGYPDLYGTPEDWRGTTWLLPLGTTMHLALASVLDCMGLTTDDVTMVNMDVSSAYNAFKAGEGDGCGVWTATALAAEAEGYIKAGEINATNRFVPSCFFANPSYLESNREVVKTVLELYLETAYWASQPEHVELCAEILLESSDEDGIKTTLENCLESYRMCTQLSLEEQAELARQIIEDPMGRQEGMNALQYTLVNTFDFFESIGSYTAQDRQKIMDDNLIDVSLLLEIAGER